MDNIKDFKILTNCNLCHERSLYILDGKNDGLMQCLNCGYASANKFLGKQEECTAFKELPEDMKQMSKYDINRTWIPSVMTLPMGALNPILVEEDMFWSFAPLVEISEEDKHKYVNDDGQEYDQRYDIEQVKLFKTFKDALSELNAKFSKEEDIKLPTLHSS
jgi:hypothetical protein